MTGWLSDLTNGAPVADGTVAVNTFFGELVAPQPTDASGVTDFALPDGYDEATVVGRAGNDVVFEVRSLKSVEVETRVMHTFDDRKLYKPNETVTVKGYVRHLERDPETSATACVGLGGGLLDRAC